MLPILFILALSSPALSNMEPFIVGGKDASISRWPFITFIEVAIRDKMVSACGGSLLSAQTVLTAAHCLDDVTQNKKLMAQMQFTIYMGHNSYNKASMSRRVIDYQTPTEYEPSNEDVRGDIGIMFLFTPVRFSANVKKVILFSRKFNTKSERKLMVAGWGKTSPTSIINSKLKDVTLKVISGRNCYRKVPFVDVKSVVCTETSKDYAYSGDSGGPMVIPSSRYQLGIVSFRHEDTGVTVFTSVPCYYDWIKNTQLSLYRKHCNKG